MGDIMNRIPLVLDLSALVGLEVIQVAIGQYEVIIQLHPIGAIRLEGGWTLKDKDGRLIDHSMEHSERDAWRIHKIIGSKISECIVRDEKHLDISFDGFSLEIEDDSDQYETFSIDHPLVKLYV